MPISAPLNELETIFFCCLKIELLKKLAEDSKRACFEGPHQQEVQLYHFCPFILAIIFVLLLGLKFLWSDYHLEMHIFGTVGAHALAERPKDFCQYDFLHGLWYHKILHESKMVSIIVLEYLAPLAGACQSLRAQTMEYQSWRKIFGEKVIVCAPNLLAS